jgi:hypothetical protein
MRYSLSMQREIIADIVEAIRSVKHRAEQASVKGDHIELQRLMGDLLVLRILLCDEIEKEVAPSKKAA